MEEEQWVLGFLSGTGYAGIGDSLHNMDWDGVTMWISNYCSSNPTKEIIDAAEAFLAFRKSSS